MAHEYMGNEVASSQEFTQVYTATHRGDGNRLPYMDRSFISFSFGEQNGKRVNIEDFNLIATIDGDRMKRNGSSNFDNITTSYEVVNGQLYWGTQFQGNTLDLTLSTDSMTQKQLDDFLMWFRGGETRELILAEHPNRAILARVAEPPTLSLLPFEKKETVKIAINTFTTSTTLYRGDISLSFQMDEPFWYAKENIFGHFDSQKQIYVDEWVDANGNTVNLFDSERNKDAIKIVLEDGIPLSSMIQDNMLLGNNIVANTSFGNAIVAEDSFKLRFYRDTDNTNSTFYCIRYLLEIQTGINTYKFTTENEEPLLFDDSLLSFTEDWEKTLQRAFNVSEITPEYVKERINPELSDVGSFYETSLWQDSNPNAIVANNDTDNSHANVTGVSMSSSTGIETLPVTTANNTIFYFYYAGTAPTYPTLEFTVKPALNSNRYIMNPANSFVGGTPYSTFTIESQNKQEFRFTLPNFYTSYNTAIQILTQHIGDNKNDVYELIQNNVKHWAVRAWAMRILDYYPQSIGSNAPAYMTWILKDGTTSSALPYPATFSFDGKTGLAYGTFTFRDCTKATDIPHAAAEWYSYCYNDSNNPIMVSKENVGDMIKSDWLIIKERNYPDSNHLIRGWTNSTSEGKSYSHKIYHDVQGGLFNVKLIYNNMYV